MGREMPQAGGTTEPSSLLSDTGQSWPATQLIQPWDTTCGLKKPGPAKAPNDSCSSYSGMLMSAVNGNREVKYRSCKKMAPLAFLKRCSPGPVLL